MTPRPKHIPAAEVRSLIVVTFLRGTGEGVDDPVRQVTAYYDLDGTLLAERDFHDEALARRQVRGGRS